MILQLKNLIYFILIFLGYFLFYNEYITINNIIAEINISNVVNKIDNLDIENLEENNKSEKIKSTNQIEANKLLNLEKVEILVSKGETFSTILSKFNISEKNKNKIINEIQNFYDLRKLRVNQKIYFFKNPNDKIEKIEIYLDLDSLLTINLNEKITVEEKQLEKIYNQESKEFLITESLYSDGLKNKLPQEILIQLIKLYSFDLDFQRDIKVNTSVSVSYDYNIITYNNKMQVGDINYSMISIDGKNLEYFKFLTDDGYIDYFNREGKNVKKSILKTPLDGARLSSNFGMRKHPISGYNKMHKGVDFAAPTGTPIYAGGNGVIEFLGNNGGYGKYIRIRHNNDYKTAYAHLSKYKKGIAKGSRVNQGDIIGYVGSTGNSTGPHLHYEIIFKNKHVNPLKLKLPSGKVLEGKELDRFNTEYKIIYANHLNLLYE